jgi:hypothetical protein
VRQPHNSGNLQIDATTLCVVTADVPQSFPLKAGMVAIRPTRSMTPLQAPDGVSLMTATPQPTEHLTVAVEDPRTLE